MEKIIAHEDLKPQTKTVLRCKEFSGNLSRLLT